MQQTQHKKTPFCQQNGIFSSNMSFFLAKLRNKPTTAATNTKKTITYSNFIMQQTQHNKKSFNEHEEAGGSLI